MPRNAKKRCPGFRWGYILTIECADCFGRCLSEAQPDCDGCCHCQKAAVDNAKLLTLSAENVNKTEKN